MLKVLIFPGLRFQQKVKTTAFQSSYEICFKYRSIEQFAEALSDGSFWNCVESRNPKAMVIAFYILLYMVWRTNYFCKVYAT